MGRMLKSDPFTKKTQSFHTERATEGDEFWIEDKQDISDVVELNREEYNSYRKATDAFGADGEHIARIPLVIWGQLLRSGIAHDEKRFRKWLNDRDNLVFRRRPGRV